MNLSGYKVAVTGGSGGIGSALITGLVDAGATVYNLDRTASANNAVEYIEVDLTDEESVKLAFSKPAKLDALIVCAGIQLVGKDSKIADLSLDTWQRTVDINMTGAFLSVKYAMPALVNSGHGSVILIGSPTGMTMEGAGYTAYGASKAGMMGLSRIIAVDYKEQGIRSNVVVPGTMSTPLIQKIADDHDEARGEHLRERRDVVGHPGDQATRWISIIHADR